MSAPSTSGYVGRFAPSPTGPLHFGSLVTALASYVDARSHHGQWLIRMEDVDTQRSSPEHDTEILRQFHAYGFHSDGEIVRQSTRRPHYEAALAELQTQQRTYRCTCTRKMLSNLSRNSDGELIYDGRCRSRTAHEITPPYAIRFAVNSRQVQANVQFEDRVFGKVSQALDQDVGDFVLHRADGDIAYQIAVVVDDALQGVTHVVRGADLLLNTPRQIALQRALRYANPSYMHIPLATNDQGEKLSKQTHASALPVAPQAALDALRAAWQHLQQPEIVNATTPQHFLQMAASRWQPARLRPGSA